jgi:C4-dicarboxylate-specific signal transduction histidine kinase
MFEIYEAQDGKEALNQLQQNSDIKLVVTDYNMPNMDGFELTLEIRKTRKKDSLVIVACTAKDSTILSSKFLKFGANDYIAKPFTKEEFNYRINQSMETLYTIESLAFKTKELDELNKNLQEKVKKEIEKNTQKQKLLEMQSRQAQMGEMIAAIAHQWKQPLNALSLIIQDVSFAYYDDDLDDAYIDNFAKNTTKQIEYMSKTIDDFRSFFKPDKSKKSFKLSKMIKKVFLLVKPQIEADKVQLILQMDEKNIFVKGYENELAQVLINIISNARYAILESQNQEKKIILDLKRQDDNVVIDIQDSGNGIKEEFFDKIFEPYFTTKDEQNGTGLGLYMSKTIIEKMGGKLSVSNTQTKGAVFTITLPVFL